MYGRLEGELLMRSWEWKGWTTNPSYHPYYCQAKAILILGSTISPKHQYFYYQANMVCLESSPSFYSYYFQVTTILFCYRAASSSSKITAAKQPTSSSFTMTGSQTFANKLTITKHSSSQQATITIANPVYIFLSGMFKS